jgi:hypothetical protein
MTAKVNELRSSLTGYGYQDAETLNMIRHYEQKLSGNACEITEDGCLSCGA